MNKGGNTVSFTEVKSWTVMELIDSLNSNPEKKEKIIIPQYQRNIVWSKQQQKLLIESIKEGMPIGALLLYHEKAEEGYNVYHLVDGLQRSTAIKSYQEKPTLFFTKENIDKELLDLLHEYFDVDIEIVTKFFVEWIQSLGGFNEMDGFSSSGLAYFLDEKNGGKLEKSQIKDLSNRLPEYLAKINKESNISDKSIPIIIYHGSKSNLPVIFERINSKGTQLNKYQIYAATWSIYKPVDIGNIEVINRIRDKYEALIEEGLEVDNYDPTSFNTSKFNYFEYFFGLGKLLSDKYPMLFGKANKKDQTESIGFNLGSICLKNDLKRMEKLPDILLNVDINKYEKCILDSVNIVYEILKPFVSFKANKSSGSTTSSAAHTEMQIVSIVGKVFNEKYDVNFNNKSEWSSKKKILERNLPYHYLYDILRNYWSGTGDTKAIELINSTRYENEIKMSNWENVFNEWFETEISKNEKTRANIKPQAILFLKYIYTHLFTAHEELSSAIYEIEHICPLAKLREVAKQDGIEGLPMSCISNLCLLEKDLNKNKGSKTYYEYYDELVKKGELTQQQANEELQKIEKRTFVTREEIEFINRFDLKDKDKYYSFLENRFKKLKEKFYELNNIELSTE